MLNSFTSSLKIHTKEIELKAKSLSPKLLLHLLQSHFHYYYFWEKIAFNLIKLTNQPKTNFRLLKF